MNHNACAYAYVPCWPSGLCVAGCALAGEEGEATELADQLYSTLAAAVQEGEEGEEEGMDPAIGFFDYASGSEAEAESGDGRKAEGDISHLPRYEGQAEEEGAPTVSTRD